MQRDEVMALPGGENPVLCRDGLVGLLICFPAQDNRCGVQIHGEQDIRWIDCAELSASSGGAMRQAGSPERPAPSEDLAQSILAAAWLRQGGLATPALPWPAPRAPRAVKVVRATTENPSPDPPHGGTWTRDPETGDLTLWE